jgi:hypothetical protein
VSDKYILIDKIPIVEPNLYKWAAWYETANRRVASTPKGEYWISTVFLALDHSWSIDGKARPILFETMVFKGNDMGGIYQERCSTYDEAIAMHERVCNMPDYEAHDEDDDENAPPPHYNDPGEFESLGDEDNEDDE